MGVGGGGEEEVGNGRGERNSQGRPKGRILGGEGGQEGRSAVSEGGCLPSVEARKLPSSKGDKRGLLPSKIARLFSAIRIARGARKAVYHHSLQDCYLLLGWQEVQEKLYTVI